MNQRIYYDASWRNIIELIIFFQKKHTYKTKKNYKVEKCCINQILIQIKLEKLLPESESDDRFEIDS